jgi:RNA polymerase sigma-70 factor (ECF subfamily)
MGNMATNFDELWTRYQAEIRRYVFMLIPRPADAADVIQETAVALLDKFIEYDDERPFLPWAIRFAYLEVLKWRQHHARSGLIYSEDLLVKLEATIAEESPMLEIRL